MINELINMNGYGLYVWTSFFFTLTSFAILYIIIKQQLIKEEQRFKLKFKNLSTEKVKAANKQETYKEILAYSFESKI